MADSRSPWTILGMLRWTTEYFRAKGVEEPRASAEVLLAHALGLSRLDLYLRYDQPLAPEELARYKALVVRRRAGEPVAYLTGHKEFWSLDFRVTPAVLIPRPETEVLVAAALEAAKDFGGGGEGPTAAAYNPRLNPPSPNGGVVGAGFKPAPTGADEPLASGERGGKIPSRDSLPETAPILGLEVGVGSGAVVVALAKELPQSTWLAVDLSRAALAVARENARRLEVCARLQFLQADLLAALLPRAQFALVVANLPYVPRAAWEVLLRDIKDFEPRTALLGGEDGLALIRPFAQEAHHYLRVGGWLALEVGAGQAEEVLEILRGTGAYDRLQTLLDYHGMPRVVRGRHRQSG